MYMERFKSIEEAERYCEDNSHDWEWDCGGDCCQSYATYYIDGDFVYAVYGGIARDEPYESTVQVGVIDPDIN